MVLTGMYSISDIITGLKRPQGAVNELNSLYLTKGKRPNPDGIDFFSEDWDVAIILDSCRYDVFSDVVDIDGRLEKKQSAGSATYEWMRANFSGKSLTNLVYVDANGWFPKLKNEMDSEIYKHIFTERDVYKGASSHPSTVTNRAIEAAENHPKKRLLIHYMQPHYPHIGQTAKQINYKNNLPTTVSQTDVSNDTIRKAYRESLEIVLDSVETLLSELTGKVVITADHGELLGESKGPLPAVKWGHPSGHYVPELVEVPWFIYDGGNRPEITHDDPIESNDDVNIEELEERLRDLGYVS